MHSGLISDFDRCAAIMLFLNKMQAALMLGVSIRNMQTMGLFEPNDNNSREAKPQGAELVLRRRAV